MQSNLPSGQRNSASPRSRVLLAVLVSGDLSCGRNKEVVSNYPYFEALLLLYFFSSKVSSGFSFSTPTLLLS
jgi:hypothetical protein